MPCIRLLLQQHQGNAGVHTPRHDVMCCVVCEVWGVLGSWGLNPCHTLASRCSSTNAVVHTGRSFGTSCWLCCAVWCGVLGPCCLPQISPALSEHPACCPFLAAIIADTAAAVAAPVPVAVPQSSLSACCLSWRLQQQRAKQQQRPLFAQRACQPP
jgi:hypothetical protein